MPEQKVPILSELEFKNYILVSQNDIEGDEELIYSPNFSDLYSLYRKVRIERSIAVLEFGSGWSTFALAKALDENRQIYSNFVNEKIRHPNPFCLMTIDASEKFSDTAINRIPHNLLKDRIMPIVSDVRMATVNGQVCHLFDSVPPFTADFIYLDGPDCDQVQGEVNGMSVGFNRLGKHYGLPMAADLIRLEPFFWPGTSIVTDGRGANAYFLRSNFKRNWTYFYDEKVDQHIFNLKEAPFGKISKALLELKTIKWEKI